MVVYRIILTLFIALAGGKYSFSQCAYIELPLENRIAQSDVVIEGRVIDQYAFEGPLYDMIYTTHVVEVFKVFAGNETSRRIEITTPGGVLGDRGVTVSPNVDIQMGTEGVFMLRRHGGLPLSRENRVFLMPVAGQASLIETSNSNRIKDGLRAFEDAQELYDVITETTGVMYSEISKPSSFKSFKSLLPPNISNISPLSASAGTGSSVTISGSGFGATAGKVFFDNANDGPGGSYVSTLASQIVSWSDNQIVAQVPSNSGTGNVIVQTSDLIDSAPSTQVFTVSFGVRNVSSSGNALLTYLIDQGSNGDGGYLFHIGINTANNGVNLAGIPEALSAIERAMQTIHTNVGIPLYAGANCPQSTIQTPGSDGTNIIAFDNDSYNLVATYGSSILGVAFAYYSKCSSSQWEVTDMDVIFRRPSGVNWYYGEGTPGITQRDFQSVVLHEMGHAFSLSHINNTDAPMNYRITAGTTRRSYIAGADLDGALYAHNLFASYVPPVITSCSNTAFKVARQYATYSAASDCSSLEVLPVELVDFDGKAEEKGTRLWWKTASELNNNYFAVEHSADGRSFREFARLQGAGTSAEPQLYETFHSLPAAGVNYYRLAQYDYDGTHSYSEIISVKFEGKTTPALIAPNPVMTDAVNLWYNSPNETQIELEIIALDGKICATQHRQVLSGNQHIHLPADNLNAGLYLLRIRNGSESQVLKFSKM